jgi:hypothetical protein
VLLEGVRLRAEVAVDLLDGTANVRVFTWQTRFHTGGPRGFSEMHLPVQLDGGEPRPAHFVPNAVAPQAPRGAQPAATAPAAVPAPGANVLPLSQAQGPRPSEVMAAVKALEARFEAEQREAAAFRAAVVGRLDNLARQGNAADLFVRFVLTDPEFSRELPPAEQAEFQRMRDALGLSSAPPQAEPEAPAADSVQPVAPEAAPAPSPGVGPGTA